MPPPIRVAVPVAVPLPASDRSIHLPASTLQPRDNGKSNPKQVEIVVFVLGAVAGTIIILAFLVRHFYRRFANSKHTYKPALHEDDSPTTRQINRRNQDNLEDSLTDAQARRVSNNGRGQTTTGDAGVDRNTSVRSVMTLPVYRPKATENERVLGREGERDGIDVVVEMRTAEDEEALRDEEMEALYQIRAARRRQLADREERRRLRREARETNNVVALRELRTGARDRSTQNVAEIEDLRTEHDRIRETRQRAVSSVSYADVGIARADGTRVRANSTESTERIGLLSDAASISADSNLRHRRDRSASTATLSIDTSRSDHRPESPSSLSIPATSGSYSFAPSPLGRTRTNSGATTPRIATPSATTATPSRAGSSPEIIDAEDADLGDVSMPPPSYPGPGPIPAEGGLAERRRSSRLSAHMERLPAAEQAQVGDEGQGRNSESGAGPPRLPSLRLDTVPQIVIEPSSARP
ncbi:hypothetical protein N0V88_004229 [Collariella sp. IMI 366227]|nr:hypothetical protein N0V88_004229 [Collariella sp. IMI 366227]